ncbi:unnamed protein product [Paramecium sonneborni]|uniref:Tetratricopeptide repeat protein n=1 Tax=Paramecium sonneborni TaxID=65129 RepID=A0A8S1RG52_9CILI|nr:unnamed protein product [Paramecium sonneborni]
MSSFNQKQQKKLNEHKELAQKQKDANERFQEGKKIMMKENKTANDFDRAIQLFSEAITLLQNSNQTEPQYAKFYAARGNAYMQTGQYQRALFDFSTAVRFEENNAEHYGARGNCFLQLGEVNDALKEYDKAIQIKSTDGFLFLNRALVYARLDNYKKAIEDYQQALKYLKDSNAQFKAHFHMGNCYRQIKSYDQSIEHLQKAQIYQSN